MPGTKSGGVKAYKTNLEKYGANFYREIGRKGGGRMVTPAGFTQIGNSLASQARKAAG